MSSLPKITINGSQLESLKGKVILITGGSSGIGLATAEVFAARGAKLVIGDLNPLPKIFPDVVFLKTDVTSWKDLVALFKAGIEKFGRIDTVFANAGITAKADYFNLELDENDDPIKQSELTLDVNLNACINTATLGLHYMQKQGGPGNIILTASGSSFAVFGATDYTSAKHGVVGFMRGLVPQLEARKSPIRINCVAPSWTDTNIIPPGFLDAIDIKAQSPTVVGYSAALLAVDESRNCETIFSHAGEFREIDKPVMKYCKDAMSMGGNVQEQHDIKAVGNGDFKADWENMVGLFGKQNSSVSNNGPVLNST